MNIIKVYKTKDYSLFKMLGGNRNINLKNANKIIASMKQRLIINPIIVNEKYEIIDGQHRFYAQRELNKEIYYIIQKGLGLKDCQLMNCNSKTWSNEDFLNGYCELGNEDYIILRDFIRKNKHITLSVAENMLALNVNMGTILHEKFKKGEYKVVDVNQAQIYADWIKNFETYPPYKQRNFTIALLKIFKNEKYDHSRMLNKLTYQNSKLQKEVNINSYMQVLSDIYNYRAKVNERVLFQ
jgi:hypothetical protein